MNEVKNRKRLALDEIKEFANNVENELYLLFKKECNQKYKVKYRSLIFNIRDRKNLTLFQKICEKTITPYRLVRMDPQEMASQELAQWRENENKHQLDMIKKSELELLACSKSYVLKTHKGEEVLESVNADRVELESNVALEDVVNVLNDKSLISPEQSHKIKIKSPTKDESCVKRSTREEGSLQSSYLKHKKHHHSSKHSKHKRKRSKDRAESRHNRHGNKKSGRRDIKKEKKREKRILNPTKEEERKKTITTFLTPTQEDFNLIDKILEGSQVVLSRPGVPCSSTNTEMNNRLILKSDDDQQSTNKIQKITSLHTEFQSKSSQEIIWTGKINMVDVASFQVEAKSVAGDTKSIITHFPKSLEIVGRITPETVWEYILKIQKSPNKEVIVVRFSSSDEINYLTLYKYYDIRRRLGVIHSSSAVIKDFYVLPLAAEKELPNVLNSIKGVGFVEGKSKPDLLIGVIVKIKGDKPASSGLRSKVRLLMQLLYFHIIIIDS